MFARAAEGVVIVIRPAESQFVLTPPLNLRGAVAPFPKRALLGKNDVAREVASDQREHAPHQCVCLAKAFRVIDKDPLSRLPKIVGFENAVGVLRCLRHVTTVAAPLDYFEACLILIRNDDVPKAGERFSLRLGSNPMRTHEI